MVLGGGGLPPFTLFLASDKGTPIFLKDLMSPCTPRFCPCTPRSCPCTPSSCLCTPRFCPCSPRFCPCTPGPVLALPGPVPAPPGPVPAPPGPVPAPPGPVLAPPGYTLNSKGECKVSRPQSNTRTELKSVPEPLTSGLTLQNHVVTRVVTHQQPGDTVRKLDGDCQHPKGLV